MFADFIIQLLKEYRYRHSFMFSKREPIVVLHKKYIIRLGVKEVVQIVGIGEFA